MTIDTETERPSEYPQIIHVRGHTFKTDMGESSGGTDSAPGAHDYFDASLAACKTLTALWFAKAHGIPLERVEAHVDKDDSGERAGKYVLKVRVELHGPLTPEQRTRVHAAIAKCPVHKLMTTTEIVIETEPAREEG